MSQMGLRDLSAAIREEQRGGEGAGARFVDLRVDFLAWEGKDTLLKVGGRWDRRRKRWHGDAKKRLSMRLQPAQYEATRWISGWFRAFIAKKAYRELGKRISSVMFYGGRRGGKSDLAIRVAIAFAVAQKRARVWLVSPSIPETEELDIALADMIPRSWIRSRIGAPWHRITLVNGSQITLRSAHDPDDLKRGRADLVVLNEAQKMDRRAYTNVRAPIADRGGLVILAANPPAAPIGDWVEEFYEGSEAKTRPSRSFFFDNRLNPAVDREVLESMADEVDERTYRREVLGEFLDRIDVVYYGWSPNGRDGNVRPTPEIGHVSQLWSARHLGGRDFTGFLGADFGRPPKMVAVYYQALLDPDFPDTKAATWDVLLWAVTSFVIDQGDEDDLIDALEAAGLDGKRTAVIPDASGEWQKHENKDGKTRIVTGRGSWDTFKRRGWANLFKPDAKMKSNPQIAERVAAMNARIRSGDGKTRPYKRHLFSDPTNLELNTALRKWDVKHQKANKNSPYAHFGDAASYPPWRFWPRKAPAERAEYTPIEVARPREAFGGDEDPEDS